MRLAWLAVAGCYNPSVVPGTRFDAGADSRTIDANAVADTSAIDTPAGVWSTPTLVQLAVIGDVDDPTLTDDMLEMVFNYQDDLYVTKRASLTAPWSAPALITELNTIGLETTPDISGDGLTLYFASIRQGTIGGHDIYFSLRTNRSDPWGTPFHAVILSSVNGDFGGAMTGNELTIYFDTDRTGAGDIFTATRTSAPLGNWSTPTAVPGINNSTADDGDPIQSADGLTLYFDSDRAIALSKDLYIARRASLNAAFGTPTVITELSSNADDSDPWVSPDERHIFFASRRNGPLQIFESSR